MYKIIVDGVEFELLYEEMIQLFNGYLWTNDPRDEYWISAKEKATAISGLLPRTDY